MEICFLFLCFPLLVHLVFPGDSDSKESACNAGDLGLIPGSGRSPGEGHGNPLQYSCLETFMDRAVWQATVHGVAKSQTQLTLSSFFFPLTHSFTLKGSFNFVKW